MTNREDRHRFLGADRRDRPTGGLHGALGRGGEGPTLVLSKYTLGEIERKLHEKFDVRAKEAARLAQAIRIRAEIVVPDLVEEGECRDPNDLPILGTAKAAHADLLVTVDKDLLDLGPFGKTAVIRPGEFWRRGLSASS